jgi:hypothetical protein
MSSSDEVRNYVYALIDIFPGFLQSPARWVADRVFGIWNEIYVFLVALPNPFKYFQERFNQFCINVTELAQQAANGLRWLVTIFVPRWARWALNTALNTLRAEYNLIRNSLFGVINTLRSWAQSAINTVSKYAHDVWSTVSARLAQLWGTLNSVKNLVWKMLTSPEYLVDWLFGALWRRFWKYVNDHAEPIAAAWWANRNTLILKSMDRFEAFLARIL